MAIASQILYSSDNYAITASCTYDDATGRISLISWRNDTDRVVSGYVEDNNGRPLGGDGIVSVAPHASGQVTPPANRYSMIRDDIDPNQWVAGFHYSFG